MEQQQPRKYVLRTTCTKNGGFQKYQPLPPQEVFQHAFWVLGTEMDVKIKRKQRFFNRKTDWMFLPVYLTVNKGLLFVYVKKDSGYILRVSSALTLNFEGNKKFNKQKNNRCQPKTQPDFTYDATIVLHFQFGELRLRFNNDENLRSWRAILLAAHHTQYGVTKIGENVAKQIFPSTSLESVVSTKSVYPEVDEKDKTEKVQIHRHPMIAPPPPPQSIVNVEEKAAAATSAFTLPSPILGSSVCSESGTGSSSYIKSANDVSSLFDPGNEKIGDKLNKSFLEQDVQHL
uniref:PH domain-containing protein n=1 Tax=Panagrolaimus davidi TaxID=227884 RepID=A0A914P4V0_9BILA